MRAPIWIIVLSDFRRLSLRSSPSKVCPGDIDIVAMPMEGRGEGEEERRRGGAEERRKGGEIEFSMYYGGQAKWVHACVTLLINIHPPPTHPSFIQPMYQYVPLPFPLMSLMSCLRTVPSHSTNVCFQRSEKAALNHLNRRGTTRKEDGGNCISQMDIWIHGYMG